MNNRIIVIDDKEDVCDIITQYLEGLGRGYFVCAENSVPKGIKALQEDDPYAVAIIDMSFDNFGGTEEENKVAGMKVVEASLGIQFLEPIVLTAYPTVETASDSVAKGVFRYVVKDGPWLPELARIVDLAILNREVMVTISECLSYVREAITGVTGEENIEHVDESLMCISTMEKAFGRVLRARGRHPDGIV